MMEKFTDEEVKLLAQADRDMDDGKLPFIICGGQRWIANQAYLDEFEIRSGQTVGKLTIKHMLEWNIAHVQTEIALKKAGARTDNI